MVRRHMIYTLLQPLIAPPACVQENPQQQHCGGTESGWELPRVLIKDHFYTYYNSQETLTPFLDQGELFLGEPACESTSPGASLRSCFPGTKVAWSQCDDFVDMALICHRHIISASAEARVKYSSLNQSCLAPLWPLEYIILLSNAQYTSICQHSILSLPLFSIQISSPFTFVFCVLAFCAFHLSHFQSSDL